MTPDRWKQVGELFHAALGEPREARKAWVEAACGEDAELRAEVLSLLGSDAVAGESYLEKKIQPAVESILQGEARAVPERVGPYRLIRELGRGGMGTVYLAERDDQEYQSQVAIKLMRRGMDTEVILSRFYRERQTLAKLQHPNIARLLDGGTTPEGDPYIVMEYVAGSRIHEYCTTHRLTTKERLTLFLTVCKAVSYAHRQFVVHRDLKPGNILVDTAGDVKLLDFGICKLLQAEAVEADQTVEIGLVALTPDYASPEQIRGDPITVASDVYSLGAVLYELLTGVKVHKFEDHSLRGMERAICEMEIARPSEVTRDRGAAKALRGDIDNILLRALDKDPNSRYETVDQFAEDLRRHLEDEPVRARPNSAWYRLKKFARRRQGLVAAAAAILATLTGALHVSMQSARVANENLRMVRQIANTFLVDVHDAVRNLPGSTRAREMIMQTGLQYLDRLSQHAAGDGEFERELAVAYQRVGEVQGMVVNSNAGRTQDALTLYQKAMALLDSALRTNPRDHEALRQKIILGRRLGVLQDYRRQTQAALASFAMAKEVAEAGLAWSPGDESFELQLAEVHVSWSGVLLRLANWEDAMKGYSKAVELMVPLEKKYPEHWEIVASLAAAYAGIGQCSIRTSRFEEALAAHRQSIRRREELAKQHPQNTFMQRELMIAYSHVADLLGFPNSPNMGDREGALREFERVLALARSLYDTDPNDQRGRRDLAMALVRTASVQAEKNAAERVAMLLRALELQRELARVSPENMTNQGELSITYRFLGEAHEGAGEASKAAAAFREGIRIADTIAAEAAPAVLSSTITCYRLLGINQARAGDRRAAVELAQRVVEFEKESISQRKAIPEPSRKILAARSVAARGFTYAALAKSAHRQEGDAAEARLQLGKGVQFFQELENKPMFTKGNRRELESVQRELEGLR